MTYEFPPDGILDIGRTLRSMMGYGFWLFSWSIPFAGIWYFERRLRSRPCTIWILLGWIVGPLIVGVLLWLQRLDGHVTGGHYGMLAFDLICSALVWIHAVWALATRNKLVREQAGCVLYTTLAVLVVGFTYLALLPGIGGHREASKRSQCKNNLKQIGLSFHTWHEWHDRFPDALSQETGPPRSWRVELLPDLDQQLAYNSYNKFIPWDVAPNSQMAKLHIDVLSCPSIPVSQQMDAEGNSYTAYAALIGPHTAFPEGRGLPIRQFTDGTSNTILIVEACGQQIVWTEPRDILVRPENIGINLPGERKYHSPANWSSYHAGGAHTLLTDGSVRFLSNKTDPAVLEALITRDGGEVVDHY